ncbi:MAG TPA: CrcB family protein [Thermoleophilaceae bacterium]|nr:CrcB family protein [Thermoleophilaceae bacterium]
MTSTPADRDREAAVRRRRAPGAGFRPAAWAADRGLTVGQLLATAILIGGAAGALARAGLAEALPADAGEWPWGTFLANQLGALLLAWLTTELAEVVAPTRFWRPLLGTGLCGALTTFSAFQVETIQIARHGRPGLAAAYAVVSIAVGMTCAVAGTVYARRKAYG